jgi:hypothetical protein
MEPSNSRFSFPVIMVKKKDGSMRLVCDLRRLNAVTVYQASPPHFTMTDLQQTLGFKGAKILSSLDLRSGYNQILTRESDRKYCSIRLPGMFNCQYRRMPQGAINAPRVFQRIMNIVLSGLSFDICLAYLDDVICFSEDMESHRRHLQMIFDRLREANLMLHPSKCDFAKKETKFLGHIISGEYIRVDPAKTEKVVNFPRPRSVN